MRTCVLVAAACGCDGVFGLEQIPPLPPDAAPPIDTPFGAPVPLPGLVNSAITEEDDPSLTDDLLELYLLRNSDLWVATRSSPADPWPAPVRIEELATASTELRPSVSGDGLTLYFARDAGGHRDVFVATRATRATPWGQPEALALDLNRSDTNELPGWSSPDGLTLLVESYPVSMGDHELYIATRPSLTEPFTSVPFTALNDVSNDGGAWATADGNTIVFESNRSGTTGIWEAIKVGDTWFVHFRVELDSPRSDGTPWLSRDGSVVVFSSNRDGGGATDDLFIATR